MGKASSILAVLAVVILTASGVSAATIGFETAPAGLFDGSVTESGFTYSEHSGGLFVDPNSGNPNAHMNGSTEAGGGVLKLVSEVPGQDFQFVRLDLAGLLISASGSVQITVTGLDGGATVASDTFTATLDPNGFVWVTQNALNLASKTLDELRIDLPAEFSGAGTKFLLSTVDNVVLDALPGRVAVPEPATLALLGAGLLGLGWRRRQRV